MSLFLNARMTNARRWTVGLVLLLGIPVFSSAAEPGFKESAPLIERVRQATERFTDIGFALAHHWGPATPCVSGPDAGAMGVHFTRTDVDHIHDGILDVQNPEFLIYEPMSGGAMRLVGVEFLVLADEWAAHNPGKGPPVLEGNLLNFVDAPNRYGLPPFYELHVWAWENNPKGSYADWNTQVTCERQALD